MKNSLFLLVAVCLLGISNAHAQRGQDRGSGNLSGVRSGSERSDKVIEALASGKLSQDAANYVDWLIELVGDYTPEHAQIRALGIALKEDILGTHIKFEKECLVDGEPQSFSTIKGQPKADICADPKRIAFEINNEKRPGHVEMFNSDVIGLLIHESVRHFGIEDTTIGGRHPIAYFVQSTYANTRILRKQLKTYKKPVTLSVWVFSEEKNTYPDPLVFVENQIQTVEIKFSPTGSSAPECSTINFKVTAENQDGSGTDRTIEVSTDGHPIAIKMRSTFNPWLDSVQDPSLDSAMNVRWELSSENQKRSYKLNKKCIVRPFIRADGVFTEIPEHVLSGWPASPAYYYGKRILGSKLNDIMAGHIKLQRIPFSHVP
jgi:hypothetical protein